MLARRRHSGASIRDLVHSMQVAPHERREIKRLLKELRREGVVRRGAHGKFVLAGETKGENGAKGKASHAREFPLPTGVGKGEGAANATPSRVRTPAPAPAPAPSRWEGEMQEPSKGHSWPKAGRGGSNATAPRGAEQWPQAKVKPKPPVVASRTPGVVTGRFTRNPEGYGFVAPLDRQGPDVFIPPDAIGSALHGDVVDVRVTSVDEERDRRAGRVIGVRERSRAGIPGKFEIRGKNAFVVPDDRRIAGDLWISRKDFNGAKDGELVLAEITAPPVRDFYAKAKITKVLGDREDPGIDSDLVIGEFGITVEFSAGALGESAAFPETIPPEERRRRRDLTHVPFVTIDGITAKDFDDAVAVEALPDGRTRLYVAIADVASYVRPGTKLDEDASARATSVYLPDRVVPMLPERLSNDLCSLKPDEDRLALACVMDIDKEGRVREYAIDRVVFRSRQRMTYDDVHGILVDRRPDLLDRYREHVADFERMLALMKILRARRFDEGSIDFDLPEPTIVIDLQGATTDIVKAPRFVSHQIVEEFMLAANVTVAKHFAAMRLRNGEEVPFVYRIHDAPDPERVEQFNEILGGYGVSLTARDLLTPHAVGKVLQRFEGKPEARVVNSILLRAMRQAQYSLDNVGHFGLAFPTYCHFTSPIRRYPDLLVHRAVHALLDGPQALERYATTREELANDAAHSSKQERVAMDAERAIVAIKKVRFMRDKIGEVYAGHITGVQKFGLFVELDTVFVEGLVRTDSIGKDDFYEFDEAKHRIFGKRSGRSFRTGDAVTVEVVNVSLERRAIDFKLVRKSG